MGNVNLKKPVALVKPNRAESMNFGNHGSLGFLSKWGEKFWRLLRRTYERGLGRRAKRQHFPCPPFR